MITLRPDTEFRALQSRLKSFEGDLKDVNDVAGRAAANKMRDHLNEVDSRRPNALGGSRSHFWAQAAESITHKATRSRAEINVTHQGFALQYYGGTVKPVKAKALAIPARAEAYGFSPREPEIPELDIFFFKGKKAFAGLKDGENRVWFWLTKETEHEGDDSLLPTHDELAEAAREGIEDYLDALLED